MQTKNRSFVLGVLHEDPPPLRWSSLHEVQRLEAAQHGHSSGRNSGIQEVVIFLLVIFPSQHFYAQLKVTFSVLTDTLS